VSTDNAYVNAHVTYVAPRVPGQVSRVLVEETARVRAGDLLVELDKKPYRVQYDLKAAALRQAQADVTAAESQARGIEATARSKRWGLQNAMDQVANQVATLNARAAALTSQQAVYERTRADLQRGEELRKTGALAQEELDVRRESFRVAEAQVRQAEEQVYQARVGLGLPARPPTGRPLTDVPADVEQTYSGVRVALAELVQSAAQLGLPLAGTAETPREYLARFTQKGDAALDQLLAKLVADAPVVLQARAKLAQAGQDLEQARLNLSYCEVRSEIDGVVGRRNVNPGTNVQAGQQVLAVRSVTDVWVDANFKETQLADLRIGQPVDVYVDLYGGRRVFRGRVAGFSPGTGSTLALLPAENATGNFVKVVQRLPVRIELTDPLPEDEPLFAGLSATPYVHYRDAPTGPDAGRKLQAPATATREPAPARPVSPPRPAGPAPIPDQANGGGRP
jgi:membrane fusion protein (multidrug efflux system)